MIWYLFFHSEGSVVIYYGLDGPGFEFQLGKYVMYFSAPIKNGTEAHPALHWVLALFPEGLKLVAMVLTTHPL